MREQKARRVLAWLLSAALALGLVACGEKQTPEEAYQAAVEKQNSLTDIDVLIRETMTIGYQGVSVDMTLDMDMKARKLGAEDMEMELLVKLGTVGTTVEFQTYYANGYCLVDALGQKIKYAMPPEEALAQGGVANLFEVSTLSELTMEKTDAGQKLVFTVDTAKLTEEDALIKALKENLANAGLSEGDVELAFTSISGSITVNQDGYIETLDMDLECTLKTEGQDMKMVMNLNGTYKNPGQEVEVTIPDASGYAEISSSVFD